MSKSLIRSTRKYCIETPKLLEVVRKIVVFVAAWLIASASMMQSTSISPRLGSNHRYVSSNGHLRHLQNLRHDQISLKPEVTSATIYLNPFSLIYQFSNTTETAVSSNFDSYEVDFLTSYTETYLEEEYRTADMSDADVSVKLTNDESFTQIGRTVKDRNILTFTGYANFTSSTPFIPLYEELLDYVTERAFQNEELYLDGIKTSANGSLGDSFSKVVSVTYSLSNKSLDKTQNSETPETSRGFGANKTDTESSNTTSVESDTPSQGEDSGTSMTESAAVSSTSANTDASRRKFPIIIGTVFGGLALLVIVSIVIVFAKRRERKQTFSQLDNAKEVSHEYDTAHKQAEKSPTNSLVLQNGDNQDELVAKNCNSSDTLLHSPKRIFMKGFKLISPNRDTKGGEMNWHNDKDKCKFDYLSYASSANIQDASDARSYMDQSGSSSVAPPSIFVYSVGGEERKIGASLGGENEELGLSDPDNFSLAEMSVMDEERFDSVLQIQAVDSVTGGSFGLPSQEDKEEAEETFMENYWDEKSSGFSLGYSVEGDTDTLQSAAGDTMNPTRDRTFTIEKKILVEDKQTLNDAEVDQSRKENLEKMDTASI